MTQSPVQHFLRLLLHFLVRCEPLARPERRLLLRVLYLPVRIATGIFRCLLANKQLLLNVPYLVVTHEQLPGRRGQLLHLPFKLVNGAHFSGMRQHILIVQFLKLAQVVGMLRIADPSVRGVNCPRSLLFRQRIIRGGLGIQGRHVIDAALRAVLFGDFDAGDSSSSD